MSSDTDVDLHFSDYWRVICNRWPIVATILILVLLTAYLYSKSRPQIFASTVDLKVEKEMKELEVFSRSNDVFDPIFFQTEFELIKSKTILEEVIKKTNYVQIKARELAEEVENFEPLAYQFLNKVDLSVEAERNTNIIKITAYSQDREFAAVLANKVAEVYKDYRLNLIEDTSTKGLDAVKQKINQQQKVVDDAKRKVVELRTELSIAPGGGGTLNATTSHEDLRLQQMQSDLVMASRNYQQRKTQYEKIKNLSLEELESALPVLGLEDSTITTLKQALFRSIASEASLKKSGFGDNHPDMQKAIAEKNRYRQQLNEKLEGARKGLEINLAVAQTDFEVLEKEIEDLKIKQKVEKVEKVLPYEEAKAEYDSHKYRLDQLRARFDQLEADENVGSRPVTIISRAEPGLKPVSPKLGLNLALGGVAGLILGISLAFFIEYLDTSVKSLDDVEKFLGTSVVGVIPEGVSTLNLEGPDSPNAEAYRILRAKIDLKSSQAGAKTLTIVSGGPGEGKTTTLFNLGYVCAYSGIRTLMIDTDFRRHEVNRVLGIQNEPGLADYLLGKQEISRLIRETEIPNMHVITAGNLPSEYMGALSPDRLTELIRSLRPHYDAILFDSPPILGISDAAVIVHEVDMTLLTIQHRRYPRNISFRAKKVIEEVQGRLVGVVLNKVQIKSDESYYYYTSYYGYSGVSSEKSRKDTIKMTKENLKKRKKQEKLVKTAQTNANSQKGSSEDRY
ncbi:MAG: polysaccharide biosynthesis tyrosine autokinase [Verrucomicrobiota bacterium]